MKTIIKHLSLCLSLTCLLAPVTFSQNLLNTAFDTNGPVGDLLFPQDEKGDIVYSEVIDAPFSADTIFGLSREFLYKIEKEGIGKVSHRFDGTTMVACDIELPVGTDTLSVGVWNHGNIGVWLKAASTVNFNLVIDIRPGKYRYTLTHFITDRWRIPGDGKDKGPSNLIHWQRVNSLSKEMAKAKEKDKSEIEAMIEKEKMSYKLEHEAVLSFIEKMRCFAVIEDF